MVRVMTALAAWAAGTVIAVGVTWFGANVVVRNAGVGPGMPVINAAVLPASGTPSVSVTPPATAPAIARASAQASASPDETGPSPSATATASPSSAASPSAGSVHAYELAGGRVTLMVTQTSVQLVTAVPNAGYSVQTWSGTGWLRVDFSAGPRVSSLIASWYEHTPTITVTN